MNAKRILVVDDDQVIANIYQNKFRIEGYEAEVAGDGERPWKCSAKRPLTSCFLAWLFKHE